LKGLPSSYASTLTSTEPAENQYDGTLEPRMRIHSVATHSPEDVLGEILLSRTNRNRMKIHVRNEARGGGMSSSGNAIGPF
jgi:hypothetical protein